MEQSESLSQKISKIFELYSVNESLSNYFWQTFFPYLSKRSQKTLSSSEMTALIKFSILVASKLVPSSPLDFSKLFFEEFFTWESYLHIFNKLLLKHSIPDAKISEISQLIQSVQVSKTMFCKLTSVWKKIDFEGNPEYIEHVKQGSWLLLISARSALVNNTNSVGDCLFLMLGVISFVVMRLPSYLSLKNEPFRIIFEIFQANVQESEFWCEKIKGLCKVIHGHFELKSRDQDFKGIFSRKNIKSNLISLSNFYSQHLSTEGFDERSFNFTTNEAIRFNPAFSAALPRRNISGKVLKYDPEQSDCNDILSPMVAPNTPSTMSMETIKWIINIVLETIQHNENRQDFSINQLEHHELQETFDKIVQEKGIRYEDSCIILGPCNQQNEVKVFYLFLSIYKKLTKEKSNELFFQYNEKNLATCLFVFSVEILFYAKNIIYVSFSDLLDLFKCSAFDFFQFIPAFLNIPLMPSHFKLHLKQIESTILMHLGWKENGAIHNSIREVIYNSNIEPIQDNYNKFKGIFPDEYEFFFEKMITEAGCRLDAICKSFKIEEKLKEKIWGAVKFIFSEKTEIIFGKHIAVIILCSIFALTKLIFPLKFNDLIHEYWKLFEDEEKIFMCIRLRNGETVQIIDFYNREFIENMRPYIEERGHLEKPRVAVLNPANSLRVQINGASPQKKSPFANDRSKCLIASPKLLCFDNSDSQKIPNIIRMMLLENYEGVIPMPSLKKNN